MFYATCRANGEFSTLKFAMSSGGLTLNAYARYREAEGEHGQAHIMVEVLGSDGQPVSGYERTKCPFENVDGENLPLHCDGKTGAGFAGQTVRLRFFLRDARVYSVTGER